MYFLNMEKYRVRILIEGFVNSIRVIVYFRIVPLMLLVHFFSDYANLNTFSFFCEATRLPFSWSGGLPLRLKSPRWKTAFK